MKNGGALAHEAIRAERRFSIFISLCEIKIGLTRPMAKCSLRYKSKVKQGTPRVCKISGKMKLATTFFVVAF